MVKLPIKEDIWTGLISRRLLFGKNGNCVAIVEFDSMNSFVTLHQSEFHKNIH
jgi:hypothetical protein